MGQLNAYASTKCPLFGKGKESTQSDVERFDIFSPIYVGEDGTGYDVYFYGDTSTSYFFWDEGDNQARIYTRTATGGNALYIYRTSSGTTGNVYGIRLFASGTGVSTGAVRGVRAEADAGDTASASLLEAGLFTAKVSSGSATVTNIRALTGHVSIGDTLTVSGDVMCVNAHMQTRSDENITGAHTGVYIINEAVGGTGLTMGSYIHCTYSALSGGEDGAEYLIDGGTSTDLLGTALFRIPDDGTVADSDGMSASGGLDNFDDFSGYITVTIGSQVTHLLTLDTIPS